MTITIIQIRLTLRKFFIRFIMKITELKISKIISCLASKR